MVLCVFLRYLFKRDLSECSFFSFSAMDVVARSLCTSSTADNGTRIRVVLISLGLSVASSGIQFVDNTYALIRGTFSITCPLDKVCNGVTLTRLPCSPFADANFVYRTDLYFYARLICYTTLTLSLLERALLSNMV